VTPVAPIHPNARSVAVVRAPHHGIKLTASQQFMPVKDVIDKSIPNPHPANVCHDKYWAQRRRLFSKFDMGIQLDAEGWYSVTPEVIANHVAQRVGEFSHSVVFQRPALQAPSPQGIIVLEAFCGCGGNAIAFGKIPAHEISLVVCVDIDRTKLRKAAYNACLYEIPKEKLIFVECSSLFILEHCYQDGMLCIDRLRHSGATLPQMVETEVCAGFFIGGLGMLPGRIDAVFMDPPWGGVDYNSLGKNGYCLEKHMKIKLGPNPYASLEEPKLAAGDTDDFFDSFGPVSVKQAKKKFNQKEDESEYWNGVDLLKVAASATKSRLVIYDMPRNTSKTSLGRCALAAGYRGNLKLEEHFLNGRLKTVTAYMGGDYSSILRCHDDGEEDDGGGDKLPERFT
jgi:trimethylguanosine synthase